MPNRHFHLKFLIYVLNFEVKFWGKRTYLFLIIYNIFWSRISHIHSQLVHNNLSWIFYLKTLFSVGNVRVFNICCNFEADCSGCNVPVSGYTCPTARSKSFVQWNMGLCKADMEVWKICRFLSGSNSILNSCNSEYLPCYAYLGKVYTIIVVNRQCYSFSFSLFY